MGMLEPTTEEFHEEVCRKFNTSLKQVMEDVEVLREWIRKQPHLPQCSSDALLTSFILSSKNSLERAKQKIDNYYTTRLEIPDFFANRDPLGERFRNITDEIMMYMIPKYMSDGCVVSMSGFVTGDPSKYDVQAIGKQMMAFADVVYNNVAFVTGVYVVVDCNMFSPSHLVRVTPTVVRDFLRCMQDFMPVILKGVIAINCSSLVDVVLNLCKPFVRGKFLERVHLHTEGPEILVKYFPKEMIPSDYGGDAASRKTLTDNCRRVIVEKRDWLMKEGSATVDEKKRPKEFHDRKGLSLLGKQGSFKTLSID